MCPAGSNASQGSGSLVHHSDFNLQSRDLALAVFPSEASRGIPNNSPPGLHPPSKLAYGLARPTDHRTRVVVDERAPLMGFLPLQRIDTERPLHAALPQPLRSVLAVSHSLDGLLHSASSRDLPRVPLMGFLPFRGLPTTAGLAHY